MQGGGIVTYNDPRRFGFMMLIRRASDLHEHPLLHHLGIEPLEQSADAGISGAARARKEGVAEALPLRSAHHRRARQHLRVRGALPRASVAQARSGDHRQQVGQAERARRGAGAGRARRARGCDQGRRLVAARLSPGRTASSAHSSTRSASTVAKESLACARDAAAPCGASCRRDARPSTARSASASVMIAEIRCIVRTWH